METILRALYFAVVISASIILFYFVVQTIIYYNSIYYRQTKLPFYKVLINAKKHMIYRLANNIDMLKSEEAKFLFNVYLPSGSEIYVASIVMICKRGIYFVSFQNSPSCYKYLQKIIGDNSRLNLIVLTGNRHNKRANAPYSDIYYINYRSALAVVKAIMEKNKSVVYDNMQIDFIYKSLLPFRQVDYTKRYYHTMKIEDRIKHLDALLEQVDKIKK